MENLFAFPRRSGVLLHPTSLPGPFGIGDFGPEAYRFVDFLAATGQHLWQMLPLTPPEISNSPYMCLSAFAGNTLLISPKMLLRDGLLESQDLINVPDFPRDRIDFDSAGSFKTALLDVSFALFEKKDDSDLQNQFAEFCRANSHWLNDFTLFMALREAYRFAAWNSWDADIRQRQPSALARWQAQLASNIKKHKYHQFLFFRQWSALKRYCASKDIKIIGDIPIFIALNSDSVWTHPELFYLDDLVRPTLVSGVPPDYFSKTGQLWNNPLYRWDVMAQDGFQWWIERFRAARTFFDIIRIDHFRGFESYWEIPATSKTAIEGRWAAGPGAAFFDKAISVLGELAIIAEDLGVITPEVIQLRDRFNFPGMKVLQFAFSSGSAANPYLPHNYPHNCVVYTGTHDNDTIIGWFRNPQSATTLSPEQSARERENALKYLGTDGKHINWDLIRLAFMSVADTAIIPFQDILGLGSEARMNIPATVSGNWSWRFVEGMITRDIVDRLTEMARLYGR